MTASFVYNIKAEFLKSKQTAAFWLTVAGAAFIPVINLIKLLARSGHFIPIFRAHPWQQLLTDNWRAAALFLLPMYVILVTSLVLQIEYRNNTFKQVFATTRGLADIFFSKFIVIHTLIIGCFILFSAAIVITGYMAGLLQHGYRFTSDPVPLETMFRIMLKLYFSVWAITAVQYLLSFRFRNFIIPVGIGLALLVTGTIINQWDHLYYFPYMYPAISFWPSFQHNPDAVSNAQVFDVAWFVVALLLGFLDLVYRKERG